MTAPTIDTAFIPSPQGQILINDPVKLAAQVYPVTFQARWVVYSIGVFPIHGGRVRVRKSNELDYLWDSQSMVLSSSDVVQVSGFSVQFGVEYVWQMQVTNDVSETSAWSPEYTFTIMPGSLTNQAPSVALVSPAGSVANVATFVGNFTDVGSVFNTFTSYQVEVRRDSDDVLFWQSGTFAVTNTERTLKQFSRAYDGTTLVKGTSYKWRAQVYDDGALGSGWSGWQSFTWYGTPSAATGLSPSGTIATATPDFTGTYNAGDAGAMNRVRITLSAGFQSYTAEAEDSGSTFSVTYPGSFPTLNPGTAYSWTVQCRSADGIWGAQSASVSFTVSSTPGAPGSVTPADGSVWPNTVPIFAGDNVNTSGAGMNAVEVIVYQSDGTTELWTSGIVTASGSRFRVPYTGPSLAEGQTIKWKARTRATDSGYWGEFSSTASVTMNHAPEMPTSLTPGNSTNITTTAPTLTWVAHSANTPEHTGGAPDGCRQVFAELDLVNQTTLVSVSGYPLKTSSVFDEFNTYSGWTEAAGAWNVSAGRVGPTASSAGSYIYRAGGVSDGFIGVFCKAVDAAASGVGLVFRRSGSGNYWTAVVQGQTLKLSKTVSSVATVVASTSVDTVDGYDFHLSLELYGAQIKVYINGKLAINYNDAGSFNTTATGHGLWAPSTTAASFDTFYVAAAATEAGTYTVPGSTLSMNQGYSWRVRSFDGYAMGAWASSTMFTVASAPTVVLDAPEDGDVLTSPTPTVEWTFTPSGGRPQETYRVIVMSASSIIHNSGIVASADTEYTLPSGLLLNGTAYTFLVTVTDNLGLSASSSTVTVTTLWTPPASITGFTAIGYDSTAKAVLTWDRSLLADTDFGRYEIYRQIDDEVPVRMKNITDPNTVVTTDYFIPSGKLVTYSLYQYQKVGAEYIPSAPAFSTASVRFRNMWLTDVEDPTYRVELRDNPQRSLTQVRDKDSKRYWGRNKPSWIIGNGFFKQFQVSVLIIGPNAVYNPTEDWTWVIEMLTEISRRRSTVCYTDGRGRQIFGNFDFTVSDQLPLHYSLSITLEETDYDEASANE